MSTKLLPLIKTMRVLVSDLGIVSTLHLSLFDEKTQLRLVVLACVCLLEIGEQIIEIGSEGNTEITKHAILDLNSP